MSFKSYAFFFNADHSELGAFYGPPCTSKIIKAMEAYKQDVKTQIQIGDLMLHMLAYKISSVSSEKSQVSHSSSIDKELYKLILCDFSDSLEKLWCSVDTTKFPFVVARNNIWTIVLPSITQELAEQIDSEVKLFSPYIGAACIDTGNPIQIRMFELIDRAYFDNGTLFYRSEFMEYGEDDEALSNAKEYGSSKLPILLGVDDFYNNRPSSVKATSLSERGELSLLRIEGKSSLTHGQKLAQVLLDYLQNNPDIEEFTYNANDVDKNFICEENKVKNYLLNLEHRKGGGKANFFINTLGIQQEDWRYLADQISGAMNTALIFRIKNSPHGISHGAFVEIIGRNERTAILQTAWIINQDQLPRLVTAYPHSGDIDKEFSLPPQNIAPIELKGNERWADIYQRADVAGTAAARACIPTPMTLTNTAPIFQGLCGFAWVNVADARKGMAKWLKNNNIGHKSYYTGWEVMANPVPDEGNTWDMQSIEPKKAYASAFAKVLQDNGVECTSYSRFD